MVVKLVLKVQVVTNEGLDQSMKVIMSLVKSFKKTGRNLFKEGFKTDVGTSTESYRTYCKNNPDVKKLML